MSGVINYVARRLDAEDLLAVMRRNPDLSSYAILTMALFVGNSIATLIRRRVPRHTILEIDLDDKIREHPQTLKIFDNFHTLQELIDTIEYAKSDKRVSALLVRLKGSFSLQMAQIQELRGSVERFKTTGKVAVIYAETFGEFSNSTRIYYLASAFSLIFVQQSGAVCLAGPSVDIPFIKNTLEKISIKPEISKRKLYKSFANMFNEEKLTPEHREMMESIVGELYDQMIAGIASGRKLTEDVVRTKILKGIHSSTDALDGLVDGARYQDEVYRSLLDQLRITQSQANFLFWQKYRAKRDGKYSKKSNNLIALIYATGSIHRGTNQHNDLTNSSPSIGSDSLCAVLRTAVKDKKVKAIVLRVDSGGGSYIASDTIYHEILAAKNAGKKIVVSMGNYAASGGYFIAMAADHIVAEPATLTGSIGVVFGKMVTRGMWERLGVTHDEVKLKLPNDDGYGLYLIAAEEKGGEGKDTTKLLFLTVYIYNDFFSTLHSYEKGDYIRKREEMLDYIYDDFTKKVAFSRKLNRDQVEAAAQGRVWTGTQALQRGLVDQLGGIEEAIQVAKGLAGIPATSTPFVQVYPKPSWMQLFKAPKNREEADSRMGTTETGLLRALDSVTLMSNVASLVNTYAPFLSSPSSSPLSVPPQTTHVFNNLM